jgi:hypothetical protein
MCCALSGVADYLQFRRRIHGFEQRVDPNHGRVHLAEAGAARGNYTKSEPGTKEKLIEVAAATAVQGNSAPTTTVPGPAPLPQLSVNSARRFYASTALDPMRMSRDASRIADEIVKHLAGLVDAKVEVRLELRAESTSGVPENVVRTVTENCRT